MNFRNWTYRQKNKYLLIAAGVFLIVVYFIALEGTVDLYQANSALEDQMELINNAPQTIRQYQKQMMVLEKRLGPFMSSDPAEQDDILDLVTQLSEGHKVTLKSFPPIMEQKKSDYTIATSIITLQGSYTNLLKVVYALEQEHHVGRVTSVQFRTELNRSNRKTYLLATIYLQNIKKIDNES